MPTIKAQMTEIQEMDLSALRDEWRRHYRASPPRRLSRDLEPRCPDRCCDSQRIRCTRTALVFPVPPRKFPVRPNKFPVPWRREFETETP